MANDTTLSPETRSALGTSDYVSKMSVPKSSRAGMQTQMDVLKEYAGESEKGAQMEAAYKAKRESVEAKGAQKAYEEGKTAEERLERETIPYEAFKPTKDNVMDLAGLFALTSLVMQGSGGGGRYAATNAMGNMAAAMQGYRSGRKDLADRELKEYDANMRRAKAHNEMMVQRYERIMKLAEKGSQAEVKAELAQLAAEEGPTVAGHAAKTQNLKLLGETVKGMTDVIAKAENTRAQIAARAQTAATKAAGTGKKVGEVQFRYNNVVTNNIEQLRNGISNLESFNVAQMPPAMGDVLINPAKGIPTALESMFANTITEKEARMFQQTGAGIKRAITNIEASGLPRGATDAAAKEYGKMEPKYGDSIMSKALYFAEVRQIAELGLHDLQTSGGTPEQVQRAQNLVNEVQQVVPYTVKDVITVANKVKLPEDQLTRLADQYSSMSNFIGILQEARATAANRDTAAPAQTQQAAQPPAGAPADARQAPDGNWYSPDPNREGKYLNWGKS